MKKLLLTAFCLLAGVNAAPAQDIDYRVLYDRGRDYQTFHDEARDRRAQWHGNTRSAAIPADLADRLRGLAGPWRFLAIATDGCSDSVHTIPYVAAIAAHLGIPLRVVTPDAGGRAVMEKHRTHDGRAATPTVVLLDENFGERGVFIERPHALVMYLQGSSDDVFARKMKWYDEDAGLSTMRDVVEMLERAQKN